MSVRVNLLPEATRERERGARQRVVAIALVVVLVAGLGAASFLQRMELADARDDLSAAQADLALAQAEVAELAEFAALSDSLDEANAVTVTALGDQTTLAGVLQDIALVLPEDTALLTLNVDFRGDGEVGVVRATGETLTMFAPGLERLLLSLDRVAGFNGVYLGTASLDDDNVTSFNLDAQLGAEHFTNRYRDGLPEVNR